VSGYNDTLRVDGVSRVVRDHDCVHLQAAGADLVAYEIVDSTQAKGAMGGREPAGRARRGQAGSELIGLGGAKPSVEPVPPVACFGERVGGEGSETLGRHELVDEIAEPGLFDQVEVVHDLRALVAEEAVVLEAARPAHGAARYCPTRSGGARGAPTPSRIG
jgi:hypothetical protein